jgi:hypothetical protein
VGTETGTSRVRPTVPAVGLLRLVNGRVSILDGDTSNVGVDPTIGQVLPFGRSSYI